MKKRRRRPPGAEKRIILFRLAVIVAVAVGGFFVVDSWLRPPIENMAAYEAKVFAMKCINEAMAAEMGRQDVAYGDIVRVTHNNDGLVTSIQSDMQAINRLKVEVTGSILEELADKENQKLLIPLGTLMGNQLTSGRGPIVEIQVLPVGYVQTRIRNKFVSAGINQTLHQIMLETSVHINVIVPGYTVRTETVTEYCIAETVIVGAIPEGYTDINGDDSSLISKVNDYIAAP